MQKVSPLIITGSAVSISMISSLTHECLVSSAIDGVFPSFDCPGAPPGFVNNTILAMYPDVNGRVWGIRNNPKIPSYNYTNTRSYQAADTK